MHPVFYVHTVCTEQEILMTKAQFGNIGRWAKLLLSATKTFLFPRTWEEVPCKRFWVSTSATGNNEVSASAKPSCAHKSRHGLSASPLHLRDFGWYFRTLPRAYARTLRIEARRNWRLKSSCQEVSRRTLLLFLGRRESTVVWLFCFNRALPALTSALRAV